MSSGKSSPVLYYIRHGQTDWNAQRRFQGRREVPLNALGIKQATANGVKLSSLLADPERFDYVASPLGRARQTMELIRRQLGLAPEAYALDDRLVESSYGEWEGKSAEEIEAEFPQRWAQRSAERWDFAPPGGESLAMTRKRIAPFIDGLSRDTIIVAHGAVGRAWRRHVLGLEKDEAAWFEFPQDKVFRFIGGKEVLF